MAIPGTRKLSEQEEITEIKKYKQEKEHELRLGKHDSVAKELAELEGYMQIYQSQQVADTLENIMFIEAKIKILKGLLAK